MKKNAKKNVLSSLFVLGLASFIIVLTNAHCCMQSESTIYTSEIRSIIPHKGRFVVNHSDIATLWYDNINASISSFPVFMKRNSLLYLPNSGKSPLYYLKANDNQSFLNESLSLIQKKEFCAQNPIWLLRNTNALFQFTQGKHAAAVADFIQGDANMVVGDGTPIFYLAKTSTNQLFSSNANAQHYANLYITTGDSLFNKQRAKPMLLTEGQWNTEKKHHPIGLLKTQQQQNQSQLKQQTATMQKYKAIIIILVLLLIGVTIVEILLVRSITRRRDLLFQQQINTISLLKIQNVRNCLPPHFLFNALSSFSKMNDLNAIHLRLLSLSTLLRNVLENTDQGLIPLKKEIETVQAYLELQKMRVPAPFITTFKCSEVTLLDSLIPAMTIQIPVENAIKHGLIPLEEGTRELHMSIDLEEEKIMIRIEDNGIGIRAASPLSTGNGIGLKVLMQTIHLMNEKNEKKIIFTIQDKKDTEQQGRGTIILISIPLHYSFQLI